MSRASGNDTIGGGEITGSGTDDAGRSRKGVSLAKTVRPSLLAVVRRKKLFERMERGAERGVIWLAGPPGAGKSTLVSSYLEHRRLTHLWYQVDRGDVDAATFFHYLGLAASRESSWQGDALPAFASARNVDVVAFSRDYFRELYRRLSRPFALVFDNYQDAPLQSPLPQIVGVALEEIPRSGSVIVISRSEPPGELARLRANQRMELIGRSDLRLSPQELRSMARTRGQTLSEEASLALHEKTQGWAAGVVLMLEHAKIMGTEAEPPSDDTPQVVFDYIAGEIFDKFERRSQEFLLSTACLTQLTQDAAERISGYSKAGTLLTNLARNDYFVTERIADGERVFQFHRLLSAFLRTRARQIYAADEWAELVRRSAALLAEIGLADEAISLLLDEGQWQEATALIVANAAEILAQGRPETLMGWLDELPSSIAAENPWVLYWQAVIRREGAPRESRRYYARAYDGFRGSADPSAEGMVLACCGSLDAIVREADDFSLLDAWLDATEAAWRAYRETQREGVAREVARSMLVALLRRRPGSAQLETWLDHACALWRESPGAALREGLLAPLAYSLMWAGRLAQAADLIDTAHTESAKEGLGSDALAELAEVDFAQRLLAVGPTRPGGAEGHGQESARAGDPARAPRPLAHQAIAHLNAGMLDEADAVLAEMAADVASAPRMMRGLHNYLQSWLSMWRGEKLAAHQQAQAALGVAMELGSPAFEALCRLAMAETLVACGDLRRAESQLRHVQETAGVPGSPVLDLMAMLTTARVALDGEKHDRALEALEKALSGARRHGLTHTLWWCPGPMARLCALALAENVEVDYVRHLIRVRGIEPDESAMELAAWPWRYRVSTLGKFRLQEEGTSQTFSGKNATRPLELLKVLVALGGRDVKVEHLADIMWPNVDGDYSYGSFTSTLHRLRRLLGSDDSLILREGRLSLDERCFWVDVWAFEKAIADADQDLARAVGFASLSAVAQRLLALYRGAFLEDESEFTCYVALREHLRGKLVRVLAKLAARAKTAEQMEDAAGCFERAIDADPLYERFCQHLMLLYEALGRRSDALGVYDRFQATLKATLKISPSAEMSALFERLSHG